MPFSFLYGNYGENIRDRVSHKILSDFLFDFKPTTPPHKLD